MDQVLPNVKIMATNQNKTSVEVVSGEKSLSESPKVRAKNTGEESIFSADGVFIFIRLIPITQPFEDIIPLDERDFITTTPLAETSVQAILAAGDCREGAISPFLDP